MERDSLTSDAVVEEDELLQVGQVADGLWDGSWKGEEESLHASFWSETSLTSDGVVVEPELL